MNGISSSANTITHEFGHMIGLPDEYNEISTKTLSEDPKERKLQLWLQLLSVNNIEPPTLGNYSKVKNANIMRTATISEDDFQLRHYITVYEALKTKFKNVEFCDYDFISRDIL
ncbi:MAG: hypothetical protein MI892_26610 [Desulfobacterales bacterium]|nr:hypothetical protein [Desulfobacterales bacterium]